MLPKYPGTSTLDVSRNASYPFHSNVAVTDE